MRPSHDESQPLLPDPDPSPPDISASTHPDAPLSSPKPISPTLLEIPDSDTPSLSTVSPADTPLFLLLLKKPKWLPYGLFCIWTASIRWARGPVAPRDFKIKTLFPVVQEAPLVAVEKVLPQRKQKVEAFWLVLLAWAVTFALVKRQEMFSTDIAGWGDPQTISCGVSYWARGNGCGLNGADCRPFNGSGFPFRCPAECASYHVLNPRAVGDQEVVYQSLVVGGPSDGVNETVYRGDSFICGAALHAGVINNDKGGCGVVKLVGSRDNYTASRHNGIDSIGFDSDFPLSFTFVDIECSAKDMRWSLLGVSLAFSIVISLVTDSPAAFFFPIFVGLYWHVGMASDPPRHYSIADLVSQLAGKFLPAMFIGWVFFDKMGVRKTLTGLTAQVEKTVLWLGGCWVGALENYTLEWIPITRLTAHDLAQQPGAKAALAVIIILLVATAVGQAYCFRMEGRLLKYWRLYGLFFAGIIILLVLPDLNLRLHHYILAILLLPGTSMQTRPSLLYQGFLVGLFLNGIARWGFDAVIQTATALQGDAQHGSLLPSILTPEITTLAPTNSTAGNATSITFLWEAPPAAIYEGLSVLVNDVERFRTFFDGGFDSKTAFTWKREAGWERNEYFRFAYVEGSDALDYTRAGVWRADGTWKEMEMGASRVNKRDIGEIHVQGM